MAVSHFHHEMVTVGRGALSQEVKLCWPDIKTGEGGKRLLPPPARPPLLATLSICPAEADLLHPPFFPVSKTPLAPLLILQSLVTAATTTARPHPLTPSFPRISLQSVRYTHVRRPRLPRVSTQPWFSPPAQSPEPGPVEPKSCVFSPSNPRLSSLLSSHHFFPQKPAGFHFSA